MRDSTPSGHTSAIRATTRARTWRDLAPHLTHQELVAAGDHLIRRPYPWAEDRTNPWCTPAQLSAACTGRHALALRSEEHTSELQSRGHLVCRLLLEKTK